MGAHIHTPEKSYYNNKLLISMVEVAIFVRHGIRILPDLRKVLIYIVQTRIHDEDRRGVSEGCARALTSYTV